MKWEGGLIKSTSSVPRTKRDKGICMRYGEGDLGRRKVKVAQIIFVNWEDGERRNISKQEKENRTVIRLKIRKHNFSRQAI